MSRNFGTVDLDHLIFPTSMKIDYIRVYQDPNAKNVGCDPEDFPTQAYINQYVFFDSQGRMFVKRNPLAQVH